MTDLKPGDRCIVIRSDLGNEGKICTVTDYFFGGEFDGKRVSFIADVIITSMGSPFKIASLNGIKRSTMTTPAYSRNLRKLPDILDEQPAEQVRLPLLGKKSEK
jgi:hypothetical protein